MMQADGWERFRADMAERIRRAPRIWECPVCLGEGVIVYTAKRFLRFRDESVCPWCRGHGEGIEVLERV